MTCFISQPSLSTFFLWALPLYQILLLSSFLMLIGDSIGYFHELEQLAPKSLLFHFLLVWSQFSPHSSHHPSIGEWAGESSVGRAASEGWTTEESTSWSVSAVYWGLRLRNRPLCVYFSLKYEWEGEDSESHCNNSWKLGPLIGIYTIPCYRALFHLDPVAKLIWKVESLSLFCWILREPSVAFCFILSTDPLLPEDSSRKITVFFFFFFFP